MPNLRSVSRKLSKVRVRVHENNDMNRLKMNHPRTILPATNTAIFQLFEESVIEVVDDVSRAVDKDSPEMSLHECVGEDVSHVLSFGWTDSEDIILETSHPGVIFCEPGFA